MTSKLKQSVGRFRSWQSGMLNCLEVKSLEMTFGFQSEPFPLYPLSLSIAKSHQRATMVGIQKYSDNSITRILTLTTREWPVRIQAAVMYDSTATVSFHNVHAPSKFGAVGLASC